MLVIDYMMADSANLDYYCCQLAGREIAVYLTIGCQTYRPFRVHAHLEGKTAKCLCCTYSVPLFDLTNTFNVNFLDGDLPFVA